MSIINRSDHKYPSSQLLYWDIEANKISLRSSDNILTPNSDYLRKILYHKHELPLSKVINNHYYMIIFCYQKEINCRYLQLENTCDNKYTSFEELSPSLIPYNTKYTHKKTFPASLRPQRQNLKNTSRRLSKRPPNAISYAFYPIKVKIATNFYYFFHA